MFNTVKVKRNAFIQSVMDWCDERHDEIYWATISKDVPLELGLAVVAPFDILRKAAASVPLYDVVNDNK